MSLCAGCNGTGVHSSGQVCQGCCPQLMLEAVPRKAIIFNALQMTAPALGHFILWAIIMRMCEVTQDVAIAICGECGWNPYHTVEEWQSEHTSTASSGSALQYWLDAFAEIRARGVTFPSDTKQGG